MLNLYKKIRHFAEKKLKLFFNIEIKKGNL